MHALYVGFVLLGIVAILVGAVLGWDWVRNFWFRTVHFLMIAVVVFEAWLGIKCPLTTWEDYFRAAAGETVSEGTFIGRCLHRLIFLDVPASSLTIFYVLFGALVLATLFLVRPRHPDQPSGEVSQTGQRSPEGIGEPITAAGTCHSEQRRISAASSWAAPTLAHAPDPHRRVLA